MKNLNNENFFNEMQLLYPLSMSKFRSFIDEYKKKNNWNELFGARVKFHDIPIDMQMGVFMAYSHHNGFSPENLFKIARDEFEFYLMKQESKLKQLN